MKIQVLKHVPFEGPSNIKKWASAKKFLINEINLWETDLDNVSEDFDLLIVMGGPMGTCDEDKYPWLKQEKKFIEKQFIDGKKILGICLGAQLIAEVLGARVYKNKQKEIGWFEIQLTEKAKKKQKKMKTERSLYKCV